MKKHTMNSHGTYLKTFNGCIATLKTSMNTQEPRERTIYLIQLQDIK